MLITMFSAKGSPGVTSSSLALAATWPRDVVLLEADPSGGDIAIRCRASGGGTLAPSPNIVGLASAARGDRATDIAAWTQKLACGVAVVLGIASQVQADGMSSMWRGIAHASQLSGADVIVDAGRVTQPGAGQAFLSESDIVVPVVGASIESLIHARERLLSLATTFKARVTPILVGPIRSSTADARDVDEVLQTSGVFVEGTLHLPLDHAGLQAIERGKTPVGRARPSPLLRAAKPAAEALLSVVPNEAIA